MIKMDIKKSPLILLFSKGGTVFFEEKLCLSSSIFPYYQGEG
jgi:hypothetical protein